MWLVKNLLRTPFKTTHVKGTFQNIHEYCRTKQVSKNIHRLDTSTHLALPYILSWIWFTEEHPCVV